MRGIADTIADFADAAANAFDAGFDAGIDGVELHGAYGCLLQQFPRQRQRPHRPLRWQRRRARPVPARPRRAVAVRIGSERLAPRISPGRAAFGLAERYQDHAQAAGPVRRVKVCMRIGGGTTSLTSGNGPAGDLVT
ncbi:oxidoreductase [Streptomyces rugosispiralis]|uniref:oxidoreductase n=1 Tax=Streptomyces rugosispiralis TaxID=2967341 RepID=UPI003704C778